MMAVTVLGHPRPKMMGLGDLIERAAEVTRIDRVAAVVAKATGHKLTKDKKCAGCKKRKAKLNKLVPFK